MLILGTALGSIYSSTRVLASAADNVFFSNMRSGLTVPTVARNEFDDLRVFYGGRIPDSVLPGTKMYQANEGYIQILKNENYTVIDLGNPFNNPKVSPFYEMEIRNTFGVTNPPPARMFSSNELMGVESALTLRGSV